jgi:hypothetical protein
MTMPDSSSSSGTSKPALVFGANTEQGRAVLEGLVDAGYDPVYAFTRETDKETLVYLEDGLGATIRQGDLQNPEHVKDALLETQASAIFLSTTTNLPTEIGRTAGFSDAAEDEYQVIVLFFQILKDVYQIDTMPRHVVFSVRDNVQALNLQILQDTGDLWIEPLPDGSIVPHYSAKGRGGEFAMEYLKDTHDLKLTLITLPFLYSNFLGFFAPLRDETQTQWLLTACFGDGSNKIDMMGASDLSRIVRKLDVLFVKSDFLFKKRKLNNSHLSYPIVSQHPGRSGQIRSKKFTIGSAANFDGRNRRCLFRFVWQRCHLQSSHGRRSGLVALCHCSLHGTNVSILG